MTLCFRHPPITARRYFWILESKHQNSPELHEHKKSKPALVTLWQTTFKRMEFIPLVYHQIIPPPFLSHDVIRCTLKTSWYKHQKSIYHLPYVRLKGFILFHCLHNNRTQLVVQGDYFPPFRRLV